MPHIHWVARQNKLEVPIDKDEAFLPLDETCCLLQIETCPVFFLKRTQLLKGRQT